MVSYADVDIHLMGSEIDDKGELVPADQRQVPDRRLSGVRWRVHCRCGADQSGERRTALRQAVRVYSGSGSNEQASTISSTSVVSTVMCLFQPCFHTILLDRRLSTSRCPLHGVTYRHRREDPEAVEVSFRSADERGPYGFGTRVFENKRWRRWALDEEDPMVPTDPKR
jgi:hypothetical protein